MGGTARFQTVKRKLFKGKQYSGFSKGFIQPLPYSGILVLGTYYSAQECILLCWVRGRNDMHQQAETATT